MTAAETKAARKRKRLKQEDHQDDCSSDLGPLKEETLTGALGIDGALNSAIAYPFIDDNAFCSDSAESTEDELERVLHSNFSMHYLIGSDGVDCHQDPPDSVVIAPDDLFAFLAQPGNEGLVDVCEISGGESGVGKLCIRRRLRLGGNVDIVTGFDLTRREHQDIVLKYIGCYVPLVIASGPHAQASGTGATSTDISTRIRGTNQDK